MAIALAVTGVAVAAFCMWLMVRIVNRKERWAKWTAVGVVCLLVEYPLSVGPVYWLMWRAEAPEWTGDAFEFVYAPLGWASESGPDWIDDALSSYMAWGIPHLDFDLPAPLSWFAQPSEN